MNTSMNTNIHSITSELLNSLKYIKNRNQNPDSNQDSNNDLKNSNQDSNQDSNQGLKTTGTNTDLNGDFNPFSDYLNRINPEYDENKLNNDRIRRKYNRLHEINSYFSINKNKIQKLNKKIANLDELIDILKILIKKDEMKTDNDFYPIFHIPTAKKILPVLLELEQLIGMKSIKEVIKKKAIFHLQALDNENKHMQHTEITGPPGSGKTTLIKFLANFYSSLGFLDSNEVIYLTRDKLNAQYVGHTAKLVRNLFKKARGKVIVIDEVYSLGNPEGRDTFARESIDTINQCLSEYAEDLICIVAGYKEDNKISFFGFNKGLARRFTTRLNIDDYEPSDLNKIFQKQVKDGKWKFADNFTPSDNFFEKHKDTFVHYGGDMETLFKETKIAHSERSVCIDFDERQKINEEDLLKGFEYFCENDDVKDRINNKHKSLAYFL